jgi:hypothetical protein
VRDTPAVWAARSQRGPNWPRPLKNTGNVTLSAPYSVTDNKVTVVCPVTLPTLAPCAAVVCTATYTITAADVSAGSVTNLAVGHAKYGDGGTVDSNQATTKVGMPTRSATPPASATPIAAPTPTPFESFEGATATSVRTSTPPPTSTGGGGSDGGGSPVLLLLLCAAFSVLGLLAVQAQRRSLKW